MIKTLAQLASNKFFYVGSSLTLFGYLSIKKSEKSKEDEQNDQKDVLINHNEQKDLTNQPTEYIYVPNIENLISLPRFEKALLLIKLSNKQPNENNYSKCIHELDKLSTDLFPSITKLEHLTKLKFHRFPRSNPFLNDGLALYISQLLNYDLQIELAFRSISCDNRFFRCEPPGTRDKLKKMKSNQKALSIYDDPAYFILFEFYNNFSSVNSKFDSKMFVKINSEMKFLTLSEYVIKHRPKVNVWSADLDNILDELDDEDIDSILDDLPKERSKKISKIKSLKQKVKSEFIERNEGLILDLIDRMIKIDPDEFIRLGGMELLILMFERHKNEDSYIQVIGNCLNTLSLNSKNRRLFVESGWLKRLHEMRLNYELTEDITSVTKELTAHKILYNLSQSKKKDAILYPNMIFPLHPKYSDLVEQSKPNEQHRHVVDIIFIHGLRGSVFKTWRQDDVAQDSDFLNKINVYIEKKIKMYTHCWPADWLPKDLGEKNVRLIGVNYESLYSLWGQELIEENKLKSSIKQRAIDLFREARHVGIGDRPCIWVCHSMGGLIVKQMLVNLSQMEEEGRKISDNTKGLIFLSTPHLGSSIAKTATKFKFATNPSAEIFELSMHNDYLVDLNKKFLNLVKNGNEMKILSLCEGLPTYLGFNLYVKTVTETSANLNYGDFCLVNDKDHLNICKPTSQDCFVYVKIKDFLSDFLSEEISNCKKCKKITQEKNEKIFEINENFLKDF